MSAPDPEVIDVEIIPLPTPFRLATPAFVTALKEVEGEIAKLKITDDATNQQAATLLSRLTTAGKVLEETRERLNKPVLEQARKINALAKGPAERIERAKATLKRAQTAYDDEQQRKARAAEEARQKELARLEKLRLAEEAEARKKADELARLAREAEAKRIAENRPQPTPVMEFEDPAPPPKTEVEKQIEAVKFAPVVAPVKASGIAWKVTLVATVTDVNKLPDIFVVRTANLAAIKATFCNGYREGEPLPTCDGVKFDVSKQPVSTGR